MKPDRHQARILAMQMLCQLEVQGDDALDDLKSFPTVTDTARKTVQYARELASRSWQQRAALDRQIGDRLEHWALERLSPVERNVIRVALVELAGGQVPPKVVINEAIEIGREYGGADTPKFVNAVLDAVWKQHGGIEN